MKNTTIKSMMALTVIGLPLLGCGLLTSCASTYQHESAGEYIDNSVITTQVKAKLLADKHVNGLPITVKSYKNTVQLSGFVNSKEQAIRAVTIAKSIPGVQNVQNGLVVKHH